MLYVLSLGCRFSDVLRGGFNSFIDRFVIKLSAGRRHFYKHTKVAPGFIRTCGAAVANQDNLQ